MKKTWGIVVLVWLVLSLALAGCGRNGASDPSCRDATCHVSPLSEIDSLMWQRPDSALTVLVDYLSNDTFPTATPEGRFADHYAQLLASELLYKNDCEQTNREDLLLAVDFFDSLRACSDNLAFLDARAHYIKGVGSYERDSVVDACREYLQALEVMEDRFDEKDLVGHKARFMALTYTHLCVLYRNQYLHEQAISFGKLSLPYYESVLSTSWHLAWMLDEIGLQFHAMEQLDSAAYFYCKAMEALPDTNNLTYRDIATVKTMLSYEQGGNPVSALEQLHRLCSYADNKHESIARYANIGEIYYRECVYDSAWAYLNLVFHETSSITTKKQAAEWLVQMGKEQYQIYDIQEELDFLVPFATQDENLGGLKSQLTDLYGTFLNHRSELSHQKRTSLSKSFIWLLIGVVSVMALSMIPLHVKRIQSVEARLSRSEEALRSQKEKTNRLQNELVKHQSKTSKGNLKDFLNEEICKEIADSLQGKILKRDLKSDAYPELWLTDSQLSRMENAVEKHFRGYVKMLSDKYPKIRPDEIHQCLLCLLNLEDTQIAALLHCDYSTVKKRSSKLRVSFGTKKELRVYLKELSQRL